ncbi:homoserine dehydrogenase [Variovorax robiniae]|uniref:Homoserine dehydrogenase n=1 Tax=Variovorax robiniae TaxID=1836199 RepID=A0ABU8X2C9_9BURK
MYRDPVQSFQSEHPSPASLRPLRVGMIGIGTVGAGTFRVLRRNQGEILARAGRGIEIVIVAARNLGRAAEIVGERVELTDDPLRVASHPDVDVVVEVAGGTGPARDWVLAAIAHGKHVVTANKALLAVHGAEILEAAHQQGVAVAYEGAVAVSIPIVKALREGLAANRIEWVAGIINGTSNFILSKMRDEALDFETALAEAQALGYAEADPAFDVEGTDAAHKLALLAANAFGMPIRFADAQVEGITSLSRLDVACAGQLGFSVKLLGIARRHAHGVELRVQPALLPATHMLAQVHGSMNGVMVKGDAAGLTMYYGAGAGSEQTASAVIADLVDVARLDGTLAAQRVPHLGFQAHAVRDLPVIRRTDVRGAYYLRVPVSDVDQADAVEALLATLQVPVRRVEVATVQPDVCAQILVLTDVVKQSDMDRVVQALHTHPMATGPVATLRVEDWMA